MGRGEGGRDYYTISFFVLFFLVNGLNRLLFIN